MNYYIIAMTSFIGVCTIIFPEYLFHIFLGYRGRETFENFSLIQDFLTRVYSFILLMCKSLVIVPILIIIILTLTFLHIKQRRSGLLKGDNLLYSIKEIYNSIIKDEKNVLFSIVFYSTIISFLIITKISNLSQDRYDRYISFLFPIISMITFFISYIIVFAFIKDKVKSLKMLTLITSICTVISYFSGSVNYLFMEKTDYLDVLSEYTDSDAYCVATKINDMTIAIPLISQHKKSCYVSNADEILNNRSENGKEESIVVYFPNWKNLKIAELDTLNNLVESNEFSTYTQLVTREKSGLATSIYILE
jgi:hypothetical protein